MIVGIFDQDFVFSNWSLSTGFRDNSDKMLTFLTSFSYWGNCILGQVNLFYYIPSHLVSWAFSLFSSFFFFFFFSGLCSLYLLSLSCLLLGYFFLCFTTSKWNSCYLVQVVVVAFMHCWNCDILDCFIIMLSLCMPFCFFFFVSFVVHDILYYLRCWTRG